MDRYHRGMVAGMVAAIPMNIWDLVSYHVFHFSKLRYLDWSAVMVYGHAPHNITEAVFALASHFLWTGFLGMLFAYLIGEVFTSRKILLKGIEYSYIVGYLIYAVGIAFKMPDIAVRSVNTAVSQFIGSCIWGFTMALVLGWLDKTKNERV